MHNGQKSITGRARERCPTVDFVLNIDYTLNYRREELRAVHSTLLRENGIDAILCLTYQGVADKVGDLTYWLYAALWNILDFPGLVFPAGLKVEQEVDVIDTTYVPRSERGKKEWIKI
jgi:amidase